MKVLIIKMTSMGDLIHTFPALTDAGLAKEGIRFDWLVDNAFKEIPKWHPLVDKVIPVSMRKWKKEPLSALKSGAIKDSLKSLRAEKYDLIIDAQGLLKSNILSLLAKGKRCGFDKNSARESWTNFVYHKTASVERQHHAVTRLRQLFAQVLDYPMPDTQPDYSLTPEAISPDNYLVFLPNTTWNTKHYPEKYWHELIKLATDKGLSIQIPWGSPHEKDRAERLAKDNNAVTVLPRLSITAVAKIIAKAKGVIALDTGLCHVAAAYNVPTVSLYGPTNPKLTGAVGLNQTWLAADFECAPCFRRQCNYPGAHAVEPPCFSSQPPNNVWQAFEALALTQFQSVGS